jgi:hypothetical protein
LYSCWLPSHYFLLQPQPLTGADFQLLRRIIRFWKTVPSDHISWLLRQVNHALVDHSTPLLTFTSTPPPSSLTRAALLARKLRSFAAPQPESLQDRCGLFMAVAEHLSASSRPGLQTIDVRKGAVEWLRRHGDLKIVRSELQL